MSAIKKPKRDLMPAKSQCCQGCGCRDKVGNCKEAKPPKSYEGVKPPCWEIKRP